MGKLCAAGSMLLALPCVASTTHVSAPRSIPWEAEVVVRCGDFVGTAEHIGGGRYITADHVVAQDTNCSIKGEKVQITHRDSIMDIAELSGPAISDKFEIDCGGYRPNHHYLASGYAMGVAHLILPMIYSYFGRHPDGGNGMFVGPDPQPGMSGGAVIGEDYRMPGIVNQRWPARSRSLGDTYLCGGKLNA